MGDPPSDPGAERPSARVLADLGIALAEAPEIGDMLQRLAEGAREVSGARYAAIGVLDATGTGLAEFVTAGMTEGARRAIGDPPRGRGLLGAIIAGRAALRVDDIASDPRSVGFPDGHPPMSTFLGVPIVLGGRVFGNIYVAGEEGARPFTASDERLLETLAAYAAVAIRGAELGEERRRWAAGLEGICGISGAIGRSLEVGELLPEATRQCRTLLGCETVGIAKFTPDGIGFPFAHGIDALRLEALETGDATIDGLCPAIERALPDRHCLARPMLNDDRPIGALVAIGSDEFDDWHGQVLDILAEHIAGAIANAEQFDAERRRLLQEADERAEAVEARLNREAQARALMAQEAERSRVARELHDETGQLLTGISLRLKALVRRLPDEAADEVGDLQEYVKSAQDSVRQILRRLRPVDLQGGLGEAIRELALRTEEASRCRVTVDVGPLPPTAEEVELVIYRVAQEGLTNIARHSGAGRAGVVLAALGDHLRLTVEDDGIGFDPEAPTDRMGLSGIAERVDLVGGTLRVTSSPGAGTAIVVDVDAVPPPGHRR